MTGGATHETLEKTEVIKPPSERSFGYTFAVVFSLLAAFTWWHSGATWKFYACLSVVAVFGLLGLVYPSVLRPLNLLWLKFGLLLHKVINPVIMGLLFFGIFTPMGVVMRLFGVDFLRMRGKPASGSYWIVKGDENLPDSSMKNQF
jgi:hypothetical protein